MSRTHTLVVSIVAIVVLTGAALAAIAATGLSPQLSLDLQGGASRTILAANAASLIGAAVLYVLTVGSVRGFAFFLGLSTLLDLVVTYFFTRPAVALLGRSHLFTEARWLGVARGLAAEPA